MNACGNCRYAKRKCDKARPTCSNCGRLGKTCFYREDSIQSNFAGNLMSNQSTEARPNPASLRNNETLQQETIDVTVRSQAMQLLSSLDQISTISAQFFVGTYQRIPTLSRPRFYRNLAEWSATGQPHRAFVVLCVCIHLVQQIPSSTTENLRSSAYVTAKGLISLLEATSEQSLDLVHCKLLVTLYEIGHGLFEAAYISVAACARAARILGLHKKPWMDLQTAPDRLDMEEKKRTWWAVVNLDRFICLCSGDARFAADDSESSDTLPIEDMLWSEGTIPGGLDPLISAALVLSTPANITVGQSARESQVLHLAGRTIRHAFDPTSNAEFNAEEALQLERTLNAFIPLLAAEELQVGKYCGALAICNSSLFVLYESTLARTDWGSMDRNHILQSMEDTSNRALQFTEASCRDEENFSYETLSPYIPYALYQAAIVQYRSWKMSQNATSKQRIDRATKILETFRNRWFVADYYLKVLSSLNEDWPPIMTFPQGLHANTEILFWKQN